MHSPSLTLAFAAVTQVWKSMKVQHLAALGQVQPSESKKKGKYQESIQSSTTPDPGYQWESDNFTIRHHKQEPRGQPFPSR